MPSVLALFQGLALALSVLLFFFLQRQKMTFFAPVRQYLLVGYALLAFWAGLDFANTLLRSVQGAVLYTLVGGSSAVLAIIPITFAAEILTRAGPDDANEGAFNPVWGREGPNWPPLAIVGGVVAAVFLLLAFTPFTVRATPSGFEEGVYHPYFDAWYIAVLTVLVGAFILYPCRRVIMKGRSLGANPIGSATTVLSLSWILFAVLAVGLRLYLPPTSVLGPMSAAAGVVLFAVSVYLFRRTNLLDSLIASSSAEVSSVAPAATAFSQRLGLKRSSATGKVVLLEYDPSVGYEEDVLDYVGEVATALSLVVALKGGSAHSALVRKPSLKFLLLDSAVSYPRPGQKENEVLVPDSNTPLLLEALSKAFREEGGAASASLVFGALSDMLIVSGTKETYGFLKRLLDMIPDGVSALFLLVVGAHDEATVALLRSLFQAQVRHDKRGLSVAKWPR